MAGAKLERGAFWSPEKTRFSVYSAHATGVTLCLFDPASRTEEHIELEGLDDGIWSVEVPGLRPGHLYGYRAHGNWQPQCGDRFNSAKLLIDPMAQAITGEPTVRVVDGKPQVDSSIYDSAEHARESPASRPQDDDSEDGETRFPGLDLNGLDSAAFMPKCVVVDPAFDWQDDQRPRIPWSETVIYECHVRGMTQQHPEVDADKRGKYLGLATPPVVEHLKSLGVTAVELMPVQHFATEPHLVRNKLSNYWGYSPLGFCAPYSGYASNGLGAQVTEFKTMVRELHRAGLEVILDVVFNHSAEGDHRGPKLSLKGLDNRTYYRLPDNQRRYTNYTGCGNMLDLRRPAVRDLVLQSLRYWVLEMHVDGFRFDLATVLGRDGSPAAVAADSEFHPRAPLFEAIAADPDLQRVKLIAEPWDVGPDGYQLGNFPRDWAEWNDRYRDAVRGFWRGDPGTAAELATRFAGSKDLFSDKGPLRGINFVTSHDGFTLWDLVSYERKHNEANGEDNRDGHDQNLSRNWGHEGETRDPNILAARARARRSLLATLVLSQGIPMLSHGDEIGRTQDGNNNAYCQDSALSWVDWSRPDESLLAFVRHLLAIRRRYPALRRERFLEGFEALWWHPEGRDLRDEDWRHPDTRTIGVVLATEGLDASRAAELLLLFNGGSSSVDFELPEIARSSEWTSRPWVQLIDTAADTISGDAQPRLPSRIDLAPHSMSVFAIDLDGRSLSVSSRTGLRDPHHTFADHDGAAADAYRDDVAGRLVGLDLEDAGAADLEPLLDGPAQGAVFLEGTRRQQAGERRRRGAGGRILRHAGAGGEHAGVEVAVRQLGVVGEDVDVRRPIGGEQMLPFLQLEPRPSRRPEIAQRHE